MKTHGIRKARSAAAYASTPFTRRECLETNPWASHHPLREQINLKHRLVRLADLINWDRLSVSMSERFVSRKGRRQRHGMA
ncbi:MULTISPECIES: hypothetical protein [Paraburkholderia]|uniref:hypothetical protein n=1 Tax=Paraburkholderia TaxID=1822464 RepID=UPI001FE75758|nr:hypothetical protein [Paraburkholderia podalyriae]